MRTNYESFFSNSLSTVKGWFGLNKSQHGNMQQLARQRTGTSALSIYEGNAPKQLVVEPGQPDDNVFVNYPQTIVDKGVDFLFGEELKISIGTDEDTRGEQFVESAWPSEQRAIDLIEAATDGGIFGDAYLKIRINEQGKPEVLPLDPQNMRIETDPKNYRKILKYICEFDATDERGEKIRFKEETVLENGRWIVREFEKKTGERWLQIGEDFSWQYSFAPVFHCKNSINSKSVYGKPDLTRSVLTLCNYLSRIDSLVGKIIRAHSSPKTVALGMEKQDLQLGVDKVLFLSGHSKDQPVDLKLLEMTGDLAGAMAFRKQLRESLAEISHVPEVASGKTENIGQLSGRALQILYGPLIDQTRKKQRLYGVMIKSVILALLEIGNLKNLEVTLQWANPVPTDELEDAQAGIALKQIGVSEDTILKRLGFDSGHEREMKKLDSNSMADALGKAFDAGETEAVDYQN